MSEIAVAEAVAVDLDAQPGRPWRLLFSTAWAQHRTKIGVGITVLLTGVAFIGPFLAPYPPDQGVEGLFPFAPPSSDAWFGTDDLGRDVLSRFLAGGVSVLVLSGLSTAFGIVLGVAVGLTAAYSRGRLDDLLMRSMDVLLSLPRSRSWSETSCGRPRQSASPAAGSCSARCCPTSRVPSSSRRPYA
jgi:peptide/nickel transport system permease protein